MFSVTVADLSQVAEARRRASGAAAEAGFEEERRGQVALAATELATNLLKHAKGGQVLVNAEDRRLELFALDHGPGIADVGASMADGYSTAGTPGNGLGAVRRLANRFEIASWPGRGTAVYADIEKGKAAPDSDARPAAVAIAKPGEVASGDAWSWYADDAGMTIFVVDGLGHGTEAAVAANAAIAQFENDRRDAPTAIIAAVHRAMRHTRGGAVAVARIDWSGATVTYAGLGNIAGVVVGTAGAERRMVSLNGTAGHNARKIQSFEYPCPEGVLVMHSDGVSTSWNLGTYPGLVNADPMLIAGVLYRDYARGRDDATVVVARTRSR